MIDRSRTTAPDLAAFRASHPDAEPLIERLAAVPSMAIALSGGVDSALLLAIAQRVKSEGEFSVEDPVVAVTGVSASLSDDEWQQAREVAAHVGVPLWTLHTHELERPEYVANRGDRCYFCKTELYGDALADPRLTGRALFDGTHADDPADDRPGMRAAREIGVESPLRDAGLGKEAIRRLARALDLPNWNRPARPCLASRIAVGTTVSAERLAAVAAMESVLREEAFRVYRARIQEDRVVIQLGEEELSRGGESSWRSRVLTIAREHGYSQVLFDRAGYRAPGRERPTFDPPESQFQPIEERRD